jgi:hypothetical protein
MVEPMTEATAKTKTETSHCPFCCEVIAIESAKCHNCGRDVSIFNPAMLGWVTVAEYAAANATSEEEVMSAICDGNLDGQLICGRWLVLHE